MKRYLPLLTIVAILFAGASPTLRSAPIIERDLVIPVATSESISTRIGAPEIAAEGIGSSRSCRGSDSAAGLRVRVSSVSVQARCEAGAPRSAAHAAVPRDPRRSRKEAPSIDVPEVPGAQHPGVVRSGLASTYGPRFSEGWVALPDGPGWRFRVCGPGDCRILVSTDTGPDRAMQRLGRVVDLPVGVFVAVCGVEWRRGLCQVSLVILGRR